MANNLPAFLECQATCLAHTPVAPFNFPVLFPLSLVLVYWSCFDTLVSGVVQGHSHISRLLLSSCLIKRLPSGSLLDLVTFSVC